MPSGTYRLTEQEVFDFVEHAKLILGIADEAMEMACSRLAFAENRNRPQDRVIDAVSGMEAILLVATESGDRKGELSFRFSLHYATLFEEAAEHHVAYNTAKDLYNLRSVFAHGSHPKEDKLKIAGQKMTLEQAAAKATETLRHVVRHFLSTKDTAYRKSDYWLQKLLGSVPTAYFTPSPGLLSATPSA